MPNGELGKTIDLKVKGENRRRYNDLQIKIECHLTIINTACLVAKTLQTYNTTLSRFNSTLCRLSCLTTFGKFRVTITFDYFELSLIFVRVCKNAYIDSETVEQTRLDGMG